MTPREKAIIAATVYDNPYVLQKPFAKQRDFLSNIDCIEGFYGGSAGPGKSSGLLIAALQYVSEPNYHAILLRRTYKDLALPGALMDRAHEWLQSKAHWDDQEKTWTFKSGATLTFGYLETEVDKFRYQGAEFQFVGFDELTQFTESQYTYLFSRLRRLEGSDIPIRMRAASNPGGIGHDWVKQRFIVPTKEELAAQGRYFIRALMEDNPYLDKAAYEEALSKLDPITREQLRNGNWDITLSGGLFQRQWFDIIPDAPHGRQQVRYWDLAATEQKPGKDPDWTVGCLISETSGIFYVKDVRRMRGNPKAVEDLIKQTAQLDGIETKIFMEQEPGSSGVALIDHYAREVLKGYSFQGIKTTGSKVARAQPLSAAAANRNVKLIQGIWNKDFLDECDIFPNGNHDDQVDAASGAFTQLTQHVTITHLPQFGSGFGSTQTGLRI